jgi:hypothetical protein
MKCSKSFLVLLILIIVVIGMVLGQDVQVERKTASLSFEENLIGRIKVLDDHSDLVADFNKRDKRILKIVLKPGEYTINLIKEDNFSYFQVSLEAGSSIKIMLSDFTKPESVNVDGVDNLQKVVETVIADTEVDDDCDLYRIKHRRRWYRPNTLLKSSHINFFLETTVKYLRISNEREHFVGGNIGITLGDKLVLGFGGFGNVSAGIHPQKFLNKETILGYGGFLIGYNINPNSIINARISAIIGAGCGGLMEENDWDKKSKYSYHGRWMWDGWGLGDEHIFFFVEPQLTVYVNLTRNFKFNFNLSFRYFDDEILDANKLSLGFGLNITI